MYPFKRFLFILITLLFPISCNGQGWKIRQEVVFLADTIGNRYPASEGDILTRQHIIQHFENFGLECTTQPFEIVEYIWGDGSLQLTKDTTVTNFIYGHDFIVSGRSAADTLYAEYALVAGDLPAPILSLVQNKIVICRQKDSPSGRRIPPIPDLVKAGASAIIFVNPEGQLVRPRKTKGNRRLFPEKIPILSINHDILTHFIPKGIAGDHNLNIFFVAPSSKIKIATRHYDKRIQAANIIGHKQGSNNRYIIIGAHYDTCGLDSQTGEIRPGANDNASGVAMLMALAKRLSKASTNHNIIFVAFGGEEKGCLGAMNFVANLPFDKSAVTEFINLDMVGRMEHNTLYYKHFNTEHSTNPASRDLSLKELDGGNSDHCEFADAGIPTTHFHTGQDSVIHTPQDTPDRLNYKGMEKILDFLVDYILALDREH